MVRRTYVGIGDRAATVAVFEALRLFTDQLFALQRRCKPFGRDYHAIGTTLEALESTAYHFTRPPHFYASEGKHR